MRLFTGSTVVDLICWCCRPIAGIPMVQLVILRGRGSCLTSLTGLTGNSLPEGNHLSSFK